MTVLGIMPTYIRTPDDMKITLISLMTMADTSDVTPFVVDDGSPSESGVAVIRSYCQERGFWFTGKKDNEGFSQTVNVGLRRALHIGADALLVNADMEFFNRDWLQAMQANPADVVGALLLYPNGLVQHAGIYFSIIQRNFDHIYRLSPSNLDVVNRPRICPVTGALMLIKHATLEKVGIYDEEFRLGHEDVDYCHRVFQAGLTCCYEPKAKAIHHESVFRYNNPSRKHVDWAAKSLSYLHEKHRGYEFTEHIPTLIWDE